jgi:hypothetical protein
MGVAQGVQMGGQVAGGVLNYYAQKKQAAVDKKNALIAAMFARKAAADAISVGGSMAARALGEGSRNVGTQRASTAGRGFEIGTGTAKQITDATNLVSSVDAMTIRINASKAAEEDLKTAYSADQAAAAAKPPSFLGTLLGIAAPVASTWSTYSSQNKIDNTNDQLSTNEKYAAAGWHT